MQSDEKFTRLNERLEQVNNRLGHVLSDNFLIAQDASTKAVNKVEDLDKMSLMCNNFASDLLQYVKYKTYTENTEDSNRRKRENYEKAIQEYKHIIRTVNTLIEISSRLEKGELSHAMETWANFKKTKYNPRQIQKLNDLMDRFQNQIMKAVETKASEQLMKNFEQVNEFLPKFESAVNFGFKSGANSLLESSSLVMMLNETRMVFEEVDRLEMCVKMFTERSMARFQDVTLKNIGSKPLASKLVEIFCFISLYKRINEAVFREELPELNVERMLPDFSFRIDRRLRETDATELGQLINLINYLGNLYYAQDLKGPFFLFQKLLENSIKLYVEKHCNGIFSDFVKNQSGTNLLDKIIVNNEKEARKLIRRTQ